MTRRSTDSKKILAPQPPRHRHRLAALQRSTGPARQSRTAKRRRDEFHADFDAAAQDRLLDRCIALAKTFNTDRIRCSISRASKILSPFAPPSTPAPAGRRALRQAQHRSAPRKRNDLQHRDRGGSRRHPAAIPNKNFMLNWDPGNAAAIGSTPYPNGYDLLPSIASATAIAKTLCASPTTNMSGRPSAEATSTGWASFRPSSVTASITD